MDGIHMNRWSLQLAKLWTVGSSGGRGRVWQGVLVHTQHSSRQLSSADQLKVLQVPGSKTTLFCPHPHPKSFFPGSKYFCQHLEVPSLGVIFWGPENSIPLLSPMSSRRPWSCPIPTLRT